MAVWRGGPRDGYDRKVRSGAATVGVEESAGKEESLKKQQEISIAGVVVWWLLISVGSRPRQKGVNLDKEMLGALRRVTNVRRNYTTAPFDVPRVTLNGRGGDETAEEAGCTSIQVGCCCCCFAGEGVLGRVSSVTQHDGFRGCAAEDSGLWGLRVLFVGWRTLGVRGVDRVTGGKVTGRLHREAAVQGCGQVPLLRTTRGGI